jgi:multicomponent Na+:H+ antiporter subunit F
VSLSWFALVVIIPLLVVAGGLATVRLVLGPTLPDRVVALDLLGAVCIGVIAAYAEAFHQPAFLDVAITVGLITFLGTVAFARYIERGARP